MYVSECMSMCVWLCLCIINRNDLPFGLVYIFIYVYKERFVKCVNLLYIYVGVKLNKQLFGSVQLHYIRIFYIQFFSLHFMCATFITFFFYSIYWIHFDDFSFRCACVSITCERWIYMTVAVYVFSIFISWLISSVCFILYHFISFFLSVLLNAMSFDGLDTHG